MADNLQSFQQMTGNPYTYGFGPEHNFFPQPLQFQPPISQFAAMSQPPTPMSFDPGRDGMPGDYGGGPGSPAGPPGPDNSGPVSGIGGSVPTASAMGAPPGTMGLMGMLGPVGMAVSAANSIGNVANTNSNVGMLSQMGVTKSGLQQIGGYLGMNELSKMGVDAMNANAKGIQNDVTQNTVNDAISQEASKNTDTVTSAPVGAVSTEGLGPAPGPAGSAAAGDGPGPGPGSGPGSGQGGNGDTSTGGFAHGGLVRGRGTGTSDSIPAHLSTGEFVISARAVKAMGQGDSKRGAVILHQMMTHLESRR